MCSVVLCSAVLCFIFGRRFCCCCYCCYLGRKLQCFWQIGLHFFYLCLSPSLYHSVLFFFVNTLLLNLIFPFSSFCGRIWLADWLTDWTNVCVCARVWVRKVCLCIGMISISLDIDFGCFSSMDSILLYSYYSGCTFFGCDRSLALLFFWFFVDRRCCAALWSRCMSQLIWCAAQFRMHNFTLAMISHEPPLIFENNNSNTNYYS